MKNDKGYIENLYTPNSIRTFSGIYLDVTNPKPEMFCIEDIAHALSNIPRFGGHLHYNFTVAHHCVAGTHLLGSEENLLKTTKQEKFDFLMHDCSEAYLLDIPSPIKKLIPNYYEIEDNLMKVMSKVFGFTYPHTEKTKKHDMYMLELEWNTIFINRVHLTDGIINVKKSFINLYNLYNPENKNA